MRNNARRALITGVAGQDGYYLTQYLMSAGYEVHGIDRSSTKEMWSAELGRANYTRMDLRESFALAKIVRDIQPNEIYYLAAHHYSSQGRENRIGNVEPYLAVNLLALNQILEVMRDDLPDARLFYAASSHVYGNPAVSPQNEFTPFAPDTPYAISKCAGIYLCRYYRNTFGTYAVAGILYNHESPRRPACFVATQIARAAALASLGKPEPLVLHNLDAVVDWGAAEDYVRAMWLTMQRPSGDEYVIASGVPHTVKQFADEAFGCVDLRAEDYIFQRPDAVQENRIPYVGDSSRIRTACEWSPRVSFRDLVRGIVTFQMDHLKRHIDIGT